MADAGIATVPHLGCRPNMKRAGVTACGKDRSRSATAGRDRKKYGDAGAVMLLEAATPEVSDLRTNLPLIGVAKGQTATDKLW